MRFGQLLHSSSAGTDNGGRVWCTGGRKSSVTTHERQVCGSAAWAHIIGEQFEECQPDGNGRKGEGRRVL